MDVDGHDKFSMFHEHTIRRKSRRSSIRGKISQGFKPMPCLNGDDGVRSHVSNTQ